jgi:hypothetical protein
MALKCRPEMMYGAPKHKEAAGCLTEEIPVKLPSVRSDNGVSCVFSVNELAIYILSKVSFNRITQK